MDNNLKNKNPKPEEEVCFNCSHILWLVGVGQGIKCGLTLNQLPNIRHTCKKFEKKKSK